MSAQSTKDDLMAGLDMSTETLKPQDVVKAIAAKWKLLQDEERTEWNDRARELASSSSSNAGATSDEEEDEVVLQD